MFKLAFKIVVDIVIISTIICAGILGFENQHDYSAQLWAMAATIAILRHDLK